MQKRLRQIKAALLVLAILFTLQFAIPVMPGAASGDNAITIVTNLTDGIETRQNRVTFDLWATDGNGDKINPQNIQVSPYGVVVRLNGTVVPFNWDDSEKTSYTLNLTLGANTVNIFVSIPGGQMAEATYTLHLLEAKDGDVIGRFVFSLQASVVGLGFLIEPQYVDIIRGERASHALIRLINEAGFGARYTGRPDSAFYLAAITQRSNNPYRGITPQFQPVLIPFMEEYLHWFGTTLGVDYFIHELGEFSFSNGSGWMYAVNNVFPNVGFADYFLMENDVMRVQFTIAYGSDIGGGSAMGGGTADWFSVVNRDELTRRVAYVNSFRPELRTYPLFGIAFDRAMNALEQIGISQQAIDDALLALSEAIENPGPEFILGDINGDGIINNMDLTLLRQYVLGSWNPANDDKRAFDINGDGMVNNMDVTLLRLQILGG